MVTENEFLADGEEVVYEVSAGKEGEGLFLTDRRVIYTGTTESFSKKASFKDISYNHISSVEWSAISHPWLLYAGVIVFILGLIRLTTKEDGISFLFLIIGVIAVVLYYYLRKAGIVFITANEKIPYELSGENAETIVNDISKTIRVKK